jgi:hypothetical protein
MTEFEKLWVPKRLAGVGVVWSGWWLNVILL